MRVNNLMSGGFPTVTAGAHSGTQRIDTTQFQLDQVIPKTHIGNK